MGISFSLFHYFLFPVLFTVHIHVLCLLEIISPQRNNSLSYSGSYQAAVMKLTTASYGG